MLAPVPDPAKAEVNLRTRHTAWLKLWRRIDPDTLRERIDVRVDRMLASGFVDEAELIGGRAVAANAVGYPHALAFLQGQMREEELRAHLVRATRRYAKRQATWLRGEPGIVALAGDGAIQEMTARIGMLEGW